MERQQKQEWLEEGETSYDFRVRISSHGLLLANVRAYWKIDARLKPYISFAAEIDGRDLRVTLRPQSILSHPDGILFEKVLWRERVMSGDNIEEAPEPVAGANDGTEESK